MTTAEALRGSLFLFVWFLLPFLVSARICGNRNRSVAKGMFVTMLGGWIATSLLWLGLKRRSVDDPTLLY